MGGRGYGAEGRSSVGKIEMIVWMLMMAAYCTPSIHFLADTGNSRTRSFPWDSRSLKVSFASEVWSLHNRPGHNQGWIS